jgi:hypothetical protein
MDISTALENLKVARRILAAHHDIEDGGAPGEHPYQKPNWAMRATNAIDEAIEQLPPQHPASEVSD